MKQAGVVAHYPDTPGVWAKGAEALRHTVEHMLQLNPDLTAVWLLFPCLVCSLYVFSPRKELKWLVLSILLCAVVYLTWWLFVTPTLKAWPRRIFNGAISINLLWVFACYVGNAASLLRKTIRRRAFRAVDPRGLRLLRAWRSAGILVDQAEPHARFRASGESPRARSRAVAPIFGNGWYSAPTLAFYSGRTVTDIDTVPPAELEKQTAAYLAMDAPAIAAKAFDDYLSRFEHRAGFQWATGFKSTRWISARGWTGRNPSAIPVTSLKHDIDLAKESLRRRRSASAADHWASMDTELLLAPAKAAEVQVTFIGRRWPTSMIGH